MLILREVSESSSLALVPGSSMHSSRSRTIIKIVSGLSPDQIVYNSDYVPKNKVEYYIDRLPFVQHANVLAIVANESLAPGVNASQKQLQGSPII